MAFLLRLALRVIITLAERLTKGRYHKEVAVRVSLLSRVLPPLSTRYRRKFHGSRKHLVQCITMTLNATTFLFTYTCWGRGLRGLEDKIIADTHSGSLLAALKGPG